MTDFSTCTPPRGLQSVGAQAGWVGGDTDRIRPDRSQAWLGFRVSGGVVRSAKFWATATNSARVGKHSILALFNIPTTVRKTKHVERNNLLHMHRAERHDTGIHVLAPPFRSRCSQRARSFIRRHLAQGAWPALTAIPSTSGLGHPLKRRSGPRCLPARATGASAPLAWGARESSPEFPLSSHHRLWCVPVPRCGQNRLAPSRLGRVAESLVLHVVANRCRGTQMFGGSMLGAF